MKMSIARVVLAAAGLAALLSFPQLPTVRAADARFFELRIYHANPGKLDALNARFRNHTNKLFVKHGMELVGYWTPADGPEAQNTLVYILAYPSREAREASWKAFRDDPAWIKAKEESEKGGVLVEKVDAKFLNPTDYSPLK
ncbi:MAG: NIPSNAP family protein [Bryobacterales bacterium]